jgi:hypothetical protein
VEITADTHGCSLPEGVLAVVLIIAAEFQQRYISNGSKTVTDDSLKLL